MAFIMAAGFTSSRTAVLSSTDTNARLQPAPRIGQTGLSLGFDSVLNRISTGLCDNTNRANHLEMGRIVRRADAESQLGATLRDLKARMARKTAVRTLPAGADTVELYYKAS
jgi:hypothetical protein